LFCKHETQFTGLLSDVRLEMQYNMTDAQVDKTSPVRIDIFVVE